MTWLDNENNRTQVSDGWLPDIPAVLRRDASNRAPFMAVDFGKTPGFFVPAPSPVPWTAGPCTLCAAVESPGFYTGCMVKDGHVPGAQCVDGVISPAASLPDVPPSWVPPWASKS
jgi:hypothetical protein